MGTVPQPEQLDNKELLSKLAEILQSWPLYRKFRYSGADLSYPPVQLRLHCRTCGGERNWIHADAMRLAAFSQRRGHSQQDYSCRDCGHEKVRFFIYWTDGTFCKVGQDPPLENHPPAELAKKLDEEDRDFYAKALTSRNFGYGVGSLAYLRRIVENRMNDLLDLLKSAAELDGEMGEELTRIDEVKASWRFDDKISYAANLLPKRLKFENRNPLDFLHDLASDGLHNRSEDECLEIFDHCRTAFEYVFRQLDVQIEDASAYMASLKKPAPKTQEST